MIQNYEFEDTWCSQKNDFFHNALQPIPRLHIARIYLEVLNAMLRGRGRKILKIHGKKLNFLNTLYVPTKNKQLRISETCPQDFAMRHYAAGVTRLTDVSEGRSSF